MQGSSKCQRASRRRDPSHLPLLARPLSPGTLIKGGYEKFQSQDNQLFKAIANSLTDPESKHFLDLDTRHLAGKGGIKHAIKDAQQATNLPEYRYVLRSDAQGYYANIQHHLLLALLKEHTSNQTILRVVTQLCQRTTIKDGYYSECQKGIPLGTSLSPIVGALYLTPLDEAMQAIPGVIYIRYMDDWVVFCKSKWTLRRAVKQMHAVLNDLRLNAHPDKTFIGKIERGFDFLGVDILPHKNLTPSRVSRIRLQEKLYTHFSKAAQLYEQGRLRSLQSVERYITHWLRWAKGIGIASSNALDAIRQCLTQICDYNTNVMIDTFAYNILLRGITQKNKTNYYNYEKDNYHTRFYSDTHRFG